MNARQSEPATAGRFGAEQFREVVGHFASGVTVITTAHDGVEFGTTASAVSSLSMDPPMLLVCLNRGSSTGRAVSATGRLAVNILSEGQVDLAMRFATKRTDKFDGVPAHRGAGDVPLLSNALAHLEGVVVEQVTGGTHTVFLAEVRAGSARSEAPLAYFRGQFGRLELASDEVVLGELRSLILTGGLVGPEPLSIAELSSRYGFAPGAVHQALSKLVSERLVLRAADGRFVVQLLTLERFAAAVAAQKAIELGAASLIVGRITLGELNDLRALNERLRPSAQPDDGSLPEWIDAYTEFHVRLIALTRSPDLVDAHARVNVHGTLALVMGSASTADDKRQDAARMSQTYSEHRDLLDALARDDLLAVLSALARHLDRVSRAPRDRLESLPDPSHV